MNRRVTSLGAVIGALVLIVAACTPPPGPPAVDRINFWDVDGERRFSYVPLSLDPLSPYEPSGFIENTSTSSIMQMSQEVFCRPVNTTLSVSCVGPLTPYWWGQICPAEGTYLVVATGEVIDEGVLSGTLATFGSPGSMTASIEVTLSERLPGEPDVELVMSHYDGAASVS